MKLQTNAALCGLFVMGITLNSGAAWVNATGNLAGQPTECGDLQSIWAVPGVNKVITGVASNGLWSTANGGTTWTKISGNTIAVRLMEMVFDPDHPNTWYAGGIYHIPGIFKTTDAGTTWTPLGTVGGNDGFSVDFSDPQRQTVLASGHESNNTLFKTVNGGQSWTNIGGPSGGYSWFPYIVNTQTYLMGIQNQGYFRSVNAGGSWTLISPTPPSTRLTKTTAGELYYVGNNRVVRGSADGSTWTILPAIAGVNLAGASPVELPGGKIAVLTSDGISISADKGATWKSGCRSLPAAVKNFWAFGAILGMAYNSVAGSFYTFYWNCSFASPTLASDAIWRFDTLIGGGTDVITRDCSVQPSIALLSNDGEAFDLSGRSIQRNLFSSNTAVAGPRVFIKRNSNGRVMRELYTN